MKNIFLFIAIVLTLLTFGHFEKIAFGAYMHDVVILVFVVLNINKLYLVIADKPRRFGWYFIGFALLSFLLNMAGKPLGSTVVAFSYLARWSAYYLVFCLLAIKYDLSIKSSINSRSFHLKSWNANDLKFKLLAQKSLVYYSVTVLIIGLLQWLIYPDMSALYILGWDDHYYRLIGSWLDPNFTGLILVLGVLVIVNIIRDEIYRKQGLTGAEKLGRLVIVGLFIVGVLLTYSRSSYLALIFGALFLFRWKTGIFAGLLVGLLILGYALFVPKPAGEGGNLLRHVSVESRIRSYSHGIAIFKTSPIYGVGFNYYKYAQEKAKYIQAATKVNINSASGNDNSFILILATTGMLGLGIFILFWAKLFRDGNQLIRASMAAITVHSMFNNAIFFPAVIIWLWIIIAFNKSGNSLTRQIIE